MLPSEQHGSNTWRGKRQELTDIVCTHTQGESKCNPEEMCAFPDMHVVVGFTETPVKEPAALDGSNSQPDGPTMKFLLDIGP